MSFNKSPVIKSADFNRVTSLPVRDPDRYPDDLVESLTAALKTPGGMQTLRWDQARALYDLGTHGHGAFPLPVGKGKTLISFLAGRILDAKRPLLLLPAKLIQKTEREWKRARKDWRVSTHLEFMSYEMLGRVGGPAKFAVRPPDLIIADEAHRLKNPRAAVTRRLARFMAANPSTVFIPMSGTLMKKSVKDFAHLFAWALGEGSPLPLYAATVEEWAGALDEGLNPMARRSAGVLVDLFPGIVPDPDDVVTARRAFFARAEHTAGIVFSKAGAAEDYEGSLYVSALEYTPNAATESNFKRLREEMCRPDGYALTEAMQVWAVARQLSLGMHYEWNPAAPEEWLLARKNWAKFVRDVLATPASANAGIDSEKQVRDAVLDGRLEDEYDLLKDWLAIEPTFDVRSVDRWHDDTALNVCAKWLTEHPKGICWVEHRLFGEKLSKMTGVPYFRAEGLDANGKFIEDHEGAMIASRPANAEGRNLQHKWCDNLLTAPPSDGETLEQLIGRTHRPEQVEDSVSVEVLVACREHLESIPRCLSSADVKADMLGAAQKITVADVSWPDGVARRGPRWA